MGNNCYRQGYERGPWYELKCLRQTIASIESHGGDASFERHLYSACLKLPEYQAGDNYNRQHGFYHDLSPLPDKKKVVSKIGDDISPAAKATKPIFDTPRTKKRGRPRKIGQEISRMTAWRRKKEIQAAFDFTKL
jgi:hypothetical protein